MSAPTALPVAGLPQGAGRPGLSDLSRVPLGDGALAWLDEVRRGSGAPRVITERLVMEARDLLSLEVLTRGERLRVQGLTAAGGDLRAVVDLRVPVAVLPEGGGEGLRVEPAAVLMLLYPGEAVRKPLPGTSFVAVARPAAVWHPNAAPRSPHVLCLGPRMPAGIRILELVLLAYQALAMQGIGRELDALNPAGVLNPAAARWWQARTNRLPLSREPFLPPFDP